MVAHVSQKKKDVVQEFSKLVDQFPIIGVVNMEGLPTPQLQTMRASLRNDGVVLRMTKKRLLKIILSQAKAPGLKDLVEKMRGQPALLCARDNPFKLYKKLQKSKSPAPAKGGQTAPTDIIVPAGPTGFAPGPIIAELGSFQIKAGIDAGKVVVKEDSLVAKEGEVISAGLASVLTRLGINPMEIGLDLVACVEDGMVYDKKILAVDEDQYLADIISAHQEAFALGMECSIPNAQTIELLIGKASNDAVSLALEKAIVNKEVVDKLLGRAQAQASHLQTITN
ncbi:MAG: large subunit ribosomal protein L10 [Candidatus Woesearchaeota archaeon]|jgi:large subunit ribosomal protein L10